MLIGNIEKQVLKNLNQNTENHINNKIIKRPSKPFFTIII